ncbi:hypothetical protein FRC10_006260 [Ceratobasidium sp. 414]|nr:hypothetical protein FRC10_006260 [Ceratobasidium sp. 414]
MRAWLVNISGKANASKPADLMQEHLNLQIKTIYKAHGSNQSWEWLSTIAPCVHVLRRIAREFHTTLSDRQGTKHSVVSIEDDIRALVENLTDNHVYELRPGRAFDQKDSPPKDVISEGYQRLAYGSNRTIDNFNKYFKSLQQRFKVAPVSSLVPQPSSDQTSVPRPAASSSSGFNGTRDSDRGLDNVDNAADTVADESEDNADALFDWDRWMDQEDVDGIGYSDEEDFFDEESESDEEI